MGQSITSLSNDIKTREEKNRCDTIFRDNLNLDERKLNLKLIELRKSDLNLLKETLQFHPAQLSIIQLRKALLDKQQNDSLWGIIKAMPKGSILHVHFDSIVNCMWLIKYATYLDGCHMKGNKFHFRKPDEVEVDDSNDYENEKAETLYQQMVELNKEALHPDFLDTKGWKDVNKLRKSSNQKVDDFDLSLFNKLTLCTQIEKGIDTISDNEVWKHFLETFTAASGLINYKPVFEKYIHEKIEQLIRDNVQYVEERMVGIATHLYDQDGKIQPIDYTIEIYSKILSEIKQKHQLSDSFMGLRIIYCSVRVEDCESVKQDLLDAYRLKRKYPEIICGFDIVGYEDVGYSLEFYSKTLLEIRELNKDINLPFLFHAGETLSSGNVSDNNLYTAVELGTKRIGHGLSLTRHPLLRQEIKSKNIAVELCPISNKVLKYVGSDLRQHPFINFLYDGLPIVLSPDDPSIFGVGEYCSSYDFWMIFCCWDTIDIATLKMLCFNSIEFSTLDLVDKKLLHESWSKKWNNWVIESLKLLTT